MSTKYDLESFIGDLDTFLKANLNTKISAIGTEKSDTTLKTINSGAYFFQTMNDQVANFDPYVYYGVEDVQTDSAGPGVAKRYIIDVSIVAQDTMSDQTFAKRFLRYQRALEEVLSSNYDQIGRAKKIHFESLIPVGFRDLNNSNFYRAAGVRIGVEII